MIRSLGEIVDTVRGRDKKRLVVAYAEDAHTLEAVNDAVNEGIVEAVLTGDPDTINSICRERSIDAGKFTIISGDGDMDCVDKAVKMVGAGEGDILMKGLVSTDKYMRGLLSKEYGLVPPKGMLSHVTVMKLPVYHKLLAFCDVAVIPSPDLGQKAAMIRYLISTARDLGIERPKVACISASEQVLPAMSSSTDAAVLAKMGDRGEFGDALVDGPLALDVALLSDVARIKKLRGSSVAGDADCMLFPALDAANVFFKCGTQLFKADLACMVVGAKVPCVLTSRGDSRATKLHSIALACLTSKS